MAKSRFTLQSIATLVDKYSKPMNRMSRNTKSFSRSSQRSFARVSSAGTRMGGMLKSAFAFVSIGLIARQAKKAVSDFAKAGDEIAKTSRQIGLSAESLQELRFAADRQGVSSTALTGALQKLNKNVGEAQVGTGTLTTFLNKSNPALLKQFKAVKSNDEAFSLYIKEVNKLKTPMQKAALSQALFGRSGQDLLKLAEAGPEGIAKLRKEAQKYGIVMSTQAANQSERFVDSLTNMKAAFKGVGISAFGLVVKPLTKLMQQAADWFSANRNLIAVELKKWFFTLKTIFGYVKIVLKAIMKIRPFIPLILKLVAAFKYLQIVMRVATALQIAFNIAVSANVIGLIIIAISAMIVGLIAIIRYWKQFGAAATVVINMFTLGVGTWITLFKTLYDRWGEIVNAFKTGGIIKGLLKIGQVILDAVLYPIQQLLQLLSKIPGLGKLAGKGASMIQGFRENRLGAKPAESTVTNNFASPKTRKKVGRKNTRSNIDINVTGQKEYATVKSGGTMPPNTRLNLGLQ